MKTDRKTSPALMLPAALFLAAVIFCAAFPGAVTAADPLAQNAAERLLPPTPSHPFGTDGFGRSDTREQLRKHFEVNRYHVVIAALKALADDGQLPAGKVAEAIKQYGLDPDKPNPLYA